MVDNTTVIAEWQASPNLREKLMIPSLDLQQRIEKHRAGHFGYRRQFLSGTRKPCLVGAVQREARLDLSDQVSAITH